MKLPEVNIQQLLEAGVHFGHHKKRWNPKMQQYIFGVRNNIHIIDLRITLPLLNQALEALYNIAIKSGKILFVGTKKQASSFVENIANSTNQYFITKRWFGGTLTNWKTISNSIKRLDHLEEKIDKDTRVVWKLPVHLSPIRFAIFPLQKKDGLSEKAKNIYNSLSEKYQCIYDESGSIGKRFRRQDERGTPHCITVDYQTLKDETVTLRERDTMEQKRIKLKDLT